MTRKKKQNSKSRSLQIETLNHRIMLDGAGFIDPVFYGPTPYLSEADTPAGFVPVPDCDECVVGLETFEDDSLDFGLQLSEGQIIGPGFSTGIENLTDSVDGDDGLIDGTGQSNNMGYSYFTFGNSVTVTLPSLMQSAGLVWTDGAPELTDVVFEAFDENGNSLGTINAGPIGDSSFMGTTAEDRFFGISYGDGVTTGVTSIQITNIGGQGIEIDHIQFANCSECCEIDLELTKSVDATTVEDGDLVTWTIEVTNNPATATEAATGVQVGDVIPAGLTLQGASVTNGSFSPGTGIWTLSGSLEPGDVETLTLETTVNDGLAGGSMLVNTAQVIAADQNDVDSTPNNDNGDQSEDDEANAKVTIANVEIIDLEINKVVDATVVNPGGIATWTVSISNNAANATTDATGVTIADVLPNGLSVVSVTPSGNGTFAANTWTLVDPLAPGASETLTVVTTVDAGVAGGTMLVNTAFVDTANEQDFDSTPGDDNLAEDDADDAKITVASLIDLEVDKVVDSNIVAGGDTVTWTISVNNNQANANAAATGVELSDVLPSGLVVVSATPSGNGTFAGNTWSLVDPLAPGATETLTVVTTIDAGLAGGTMLVNTAFVSTANEQDVDSTPGDANLAEDDADDAKVTIGSIIDLEVEKVVDASIVEAGDTVTWTVSVNNNAANANVDATGVQLSDVLPSGLSVVSATPSGNGTFAGNTWSLVDPLAPGATETLTVVTSIDAGLAGGTMLVNTAFVSAANEQDVDSTPGDGNLAEDDADDAKVTIKSLIDLELTKVLGPDTDLGANVVNWVITLTNSAANANADATGVVVQDNVPAGVTIINATPSGNGTYNNGQWIIGEAVSPGEVFTLNLTGEIDAALPAGTVLTNVAQVVAADQMDIDSVPGNDDGDQSEDDEDAVQVVVPSAELLMLSGHSYIDTNNDGIFQSYELPLLGVEVQLMGTDLSGNDVNLTTFTNIDGFYKFNDLQPGTYMVKQTQPVQFVDGKDTVGNLGGNDTINDKFTVDLNANGVEYNFGELGLRPEFVNKRLYLTSTPYTNWQFVDVRQSSIWYSFDAAHQSFLEAHAAMSSGNATIEIFDANMDLVGTQTFDVAGQLVSEPILLQDGGQYYMQVKGDTVVDSLSLTITTPNVSVNGNQLIAVGTAGDDDIHLQLGSSQHVLDINGLIYEFDANVVTDLHIGASNGYDSVTVVGTDLNEISSVIGTSGQLSSKDYDVHTYQFDNTTFVGGGGYDYSEVYGSNGNDLFSALPNDSKLTTPDNVIHMLGYDRVDAYGRDGYDYASLYGTNGSDSFLANDEFSVIRGEGHHSKTKGFERVDAFGRGGEDYATLYDSTGNDIFASTPTHAYMSTGSRHSYTKGFEHNKALFVHGGTSDSANFVGLEHADWLLAEGSNARVEMANGNRDDRAYGIDMLFASGDDFQFDVDEFDGDVTLNN